VLLTEIDHVAIAVNDLEAAIAYYRDTFGAEVDHREVVESDGVEEALLKVADSYVQLLTPTSARARACTTSATVSTTAPPPSTP
jgi:methylmalonyl-CoA/ethylmalonyl-CoA epimerase